MPLVFSTSSVGTLWVYIHLGRFFWGGTFWIKVVFPLVIYSGISVFSMHLFISVASVSCMEVNVLKQNPCMPYRPGVFLFDVFKWCLERVEVYFHPWTFFEHSDPNFHAVYPFGFFCYDLSVPLFSSRVFLILSHLFVGKSSPIPPLIVARFFPLFSYVLFYLYYLVLSRYIFSLLSIARIFGWSTPVLFFLLVALLFSFVRIFLDVLF